MKIYDFFKEVVNTCNNNKLYCTDCPMLTIKFKSRKYHNSCVEHLFDYFIEKNEMVAQEIYDKFKKLDIVKIPDLPTDKKTYEKQLKVFEKYCKNNSLEIE